MPASALDAAAVESLVAAAVAAPAVDDTQPWRFRFDPIARAVEIHAAPERTPRSPDSAERILCLSAGAALFNVRTAVEHRGWEPVVHLLPRPQDPGLLAVVRLAVPQQGVPVHAGSLYDAIWRRHSSRLPFTADPVPEQLLADLADAAHAEGAELRLPAQDEVTRLMSLTAEAEWRTTSDALWSTGSGPRIPGWENRAHGTNPSVPNPQQARDRLPELGGTGSGPGRRPATLPFEPHPQLLLLSAPHDTRADWLRSGQALQRILLTVTHHGLRASLLQQALDWQDLRELMRAPGSGSGSGYPQMLIRVGYGPQGPAATRRTAAGLATDAAASR